MNKEFTAKLAINNLSFGSTSIAIIREMFSRGIIPYIFPIGGGCDLSAQKPDEKFNQILQASVNSAPTRTSRKMPSLALWHTVPDSLSSYSSTNSQLITFYEGSSPTNMELNVLKNQDKVYVTNRYTQSTFKNFGIDSIYLPLGFDSHNFNVLEKRPKIDGVTSFLLAGKAEKRKHTYKLLNLWSKKYGNKKEYKLNCCITNGFLKPEHQNQLIGQALEGKAFWNINFIPFSPTNAEYNQVLQSSEIVLAMSGSEGWGLPEAHATALGAWPVALKAHSYLDSLDNSDAIWVNPNGMEPIYDGIFFQQGGPTNQGNIFTFNPEEFYAACDTAINKAKNGINTKGLDLQKRTYKETVDILLQNLS